MTKTPYELRMEALRIAQEQANQKFYNQWEKARINAELSEQKLLTEVPVFPTTEEILVEATKLKSFIDNP